MHQTEPWAGASVEVLDVIWGPVCMLGGQTARASTSVGTARRKNKLVTAAEASTSLPFYCGGPKISSLMCDTHTQFFQASHLIKVRADSCARCIIEQLSSTNLPCLHFLAVLGDSWLKNAKSLSRALLPTKALGCGLECCVWGFRCISPASAVLTGSSERQPFILKAWGFCQPGR